MYDKAAIERLIDKLDYERWLMPFAIRKLRVDDVSYSLDLTKPTPHVSITVRDSISALPVRTAIIQFLPLLFVAGFKVLDRVAEWILEENGQVVYHASFVKKHELVKAGVAVQKLILPALFTSEAGLLQAWIALFDHLREPRNSIIHRHSFRLTNEQLEILDPNNPLSTMLTLTASEVVALSDALLTTVDLLIKGPPTPPKLIHKVKDRLDAIATLHGLAPFGLPKFIDDTPRIILAHDGTWDKLSRAFKWHINKKGIEEQVQRTFPGRLYYVLEFLGQVDGQNRIRLLVPSEELPNREHVEISEADPHWYKYRQDL